MLREIVVPESPERHQSLGLTNVVLSTQEDRTTSSTDSEVVEHLHKEPSAHIAEERTNSTEPPLTTSASDNIRQWGQDFDSEGDDPTPRPTYKLLPMWPSAPSSPLK
jgi:hypothetical protein